MEALQPYRGNSLLALLRDATKAVIIRETISADHTLRPSELAEVLALLVEARHLIMVWGLPGAAKSMIARQSPRPPV